MKIIPLLRDMIITTEYLKDFLKRRKVRSVIAKFYTEKRIPNCIYYAENKLRQWKTSVIKTAYLKLIINANSLTPII